VVLTRRTFLEASSGLAFAIAGCARKLDPNNEHKATWDERIANLEKQISQSMQTNRVPGASIAIIRDAKIAWAKGFGVRDQTTGTPVDESTVFSAQSMSKPVFAYRVMKLREQGLLDLDAPLTRYTPDLFVDHDPRLQEITARRVLSHTSGLPNWRSPETPLKIAFQPGTKWQYSGEGYHYLQSVVTRLTGHTDETRCGRFELDYRVCATDFGEYMEANVLRPFGMNSSGYVWTAAIVDQVASPHDENGQPLPLKPSTAVDVARYGSAGSLMTTATDYAKFLIEVMQPKPPDEYRLEASTLREMLTPQIEFPAPVKAEWALGWQIWHLDPGDLVLHGGDDEGWHCESAFSPERKSGFVILTNGDNGYRMIFDDLLKPLAADFIFA
jgi:CubicO group peptidase (beta-lactamase class C family)